MRKVFKNIWYFVRCWFVRNPKNPSAPRLWDLKPGVTIVIHRHEKPAESYVIKRVFLKVTKFDGELNFKAEVDGGPLNKGEIFLSDVGVVPYMKNWNRGNVPYLG